MYVLMLILVISEVSVDWMQPFTVSVVVFRQVDQLGHGLGDIVDDRTNNFSSTANTL